MKFLFVSADAALIVDFAWQVYRGGRDVQYYIGAEHSKEIGDGFVPKTDDWRTEVEWADVIVFDDIWVGSDVDTGAPARKLREEGHVVAGGTPNTDHPGEDHGHTMDVLEERGVNTAEQRIFRDFDEGAEHVRRSRAPYVIKPFGEVQSVKCLLYIGNEKDGGDVVEMLRVYKQA